MSKRYKINWKGIAGEIIGWSVIGSFLGGFGYLGYLFASSENRKAEYRDNISDMAENFKIEDGSTKYRLTSGSLVTFDNGNIDYQFDFANEMITVDGPDEADRVFQFGEYESHDMIARVRENGCQIALQIPSALEDFQSTNSIQYPEFDEAMKISTSFSNRFCEQSL